MKYAIIYQKDNFIVMYPESKTTMGVFLAQEPYIKLSVNDTPEEIISNLFACLEASKENIPHPEKWSDDFFLKPIGIKTNNALHKNSLCCSVLLQNDLLEFTPTINMGAKEGFDELSEVVTACSTEVKDVIYEYLIEAFKLCK
ncbi:MAG: hypothetical protein ACK5IQ_11210 [Bacteroidales bacterium]